jgi:hypothetical protein
MTRAAFPAAPRPVLTAARLQSLLDYNPSTGEFYWLVSPSRNVCRGALAAPTHRPNREITIRRKRYQAARLAYLYVRGRWRKYRLTYRDGDGSNNAWGNIGKYRGNASMEAL